MAIARNGSREKRKNDAENKFTSFGKIEILHMIIELFGRTRQERMFRAKEAGSQYSK